MADFIYLWQRIDQALLIGMQSATGRTNSVPKITNNPCAVTYLTYVQAVL
jgi:hypothetical protein